MEDGKTKRPLDKDTNIAVELPNAGGLEALLGSKLATHATEALQDTISQQIRGLGQTLGRAGNALDNIIGGFAKNSDKLLASYAADVAELMHEGAEYLEEANLERIAADTKQFARQHTGLFVGGLVLLGFAAVRFSRSSAE